MAKQEKMVESDFVPDKDGWRIEIVPRFGKQFVIVYKDGDARGQVECVDDIEVVAWKHVIVSLNSQDELGM